MEDGVHLFLEVGEPVLQLRGVGANVNQVVRDELRQADRHVVGGGRGRVVHGSAEGGHGVFQG